MIWLFVRMALYFVFAGKLAWNRSTSRPVYAVGEAATDAWVFADGTAAHTPVQVLSNQFSGAF